MLQRPGGETGSFGSIAGAETALTREFGRHVFEIAALLRVSQRLYNYRVWVVETEGTELPTPHAVITNRSLTYQSGTETFEAEDRAFDPLDVD